VPEEVIWRILETATWSPSAHHRQPWRFAVLVSRDARLRLVDAMNTDFRRDMERDGIDPQEIERTIDRSRTRILEAPVAILVCQDTGLGDNYPDPERQLAEYLMGVQGVAMAGVECLLAAHAEGLGGVWMCAPLFAQEATQQALELPSDWEPQGLILLGYPERIPEPRPRSKINKIIRFI
jgi:F420 biosynthesis protein FbiB-like protein